MPRSDGVSRPPCRRRRAEEADDLITAPRVEGTVKVGRGLRRLGFAEFGPADGRPLVWMHGTPGARRQIPQSARVMAEALGIRIVGIDRPGVGSSTPYRYGSVLDSVTDLTRVADDLGLERFGVIGLSGGGPYALAASYALPDRVPVAAVLGGIAPTKGDDAPPGGFVGRLAPLGPLASVFLLPNSLAMTVFAWSVRPVMSPAFELYARIAPEGDKRVFARPEIKAMFLDDILSGSRRGMAAPMLDFLLFARPWGFSVRDITVPVRWWHGDADNIVPLAHAEHMVSLIPDAELYVRPGESHLGGFAAAEEVLAMLMAVWDERDSVSGAERS
jgi:pimeloyl-ACP methyl ester carboxylesterase